MKIIVQFLTAAFLATTVVCAADPVVPSVASPPCCEAMSADLPVTARSLYQIGALWTNDSGQPTRVSTFRERPVVMAMFFASCENACPMIVADMQRLRQLLPEDVRARTQFVLVSFDTERDTPSALKTYRARMTLDGAWTLLRGDDRAVQDLAMLLGVKYKRDANGQFAHSNLITVLNAEGEITYQVPGLRGDLSAAAKAIVSDAK